MTRILLIAAVCIFSFANVWAQTPERISCEQTGKHEGNHECVYNVVGQKINNPKSETRLYGMSNMPYALCSSAKCTIDKANKPGLATCKCKVFGLNDDEDAWRKASVGPYNFAKSRAVKTHHQLVSVTSNFSFANVDTRAEVKSHNCRFSEPTGWANCFGVRCRVDKNPVDEGLFATCNCPVVKSDEFISMGPENLNQCQLPDGKVWSAATARQGENDFGVIEDMYKQFYPDAPVIK